MDVLSTVGGIVGDKPALSVDAQVGRENTKQVVVGDQVGGDQTNSKLDIEEAKEVTVNESPSFWFMLLFILGWLLPSPTNMGRWLRSLVTKN